MRMRAFALGLGLGVVMCGGMIWLFARPQTSTRAVCVDGRVCTEIFNLKDGQPVRTACPSKGDETYPLRDGCTTDGHACRCP
jgi:hypothetical protein